MTFHNMISAEDWSRVGAMGQLDQMDRLHAAGALVKPPLLLYNAGQQHSLTKGLLGKGRQAQVCVLMWQQASISEPCVVSMNCWGVTPEI